MRPRSATKVSALGDHPERRAKRRLLARASLLACLTTALPASAESAVKAECAAAYEAAQESRAAVKLRKAREDLLLCIRADCPAFVQTDCAQWLTEIDREMPTVVVSARGPDGRDVTDVRVTVDGEPLVDRLDGRAVAVDPGLRVFRFEHEGETVEQEVLVRQAQKNRLVEAAFAAPADASPAEPPAAEPADPAAEGSSLRPYAYVAGGVGGAGLAGFAVLGLLGKAREKDLRRTCQPNCTEAEVRSVRTRFLLADVSLGVGLAGLGAGAVLFFLSEPGRQAADEGPGTQVDVQPAPGGAMATVSGRF